MAATITFSVGALCSGGNHADVTATYDQLTGSNRTLTFRMTRGEALEDFEQDRVEIALREMFRAAIRDLQQQGVNPNTWRTRLNAMTITINP